MRAASSLSGSTEPKPYRLQEERREMKNSQLNMNLERMVEKAACVVEFESSQWKNDNLL